MGQFQQNLEIYYNYKSCKNIFIFIFHWTIVSVLMILKPLNRYFYGNQLNGPIPTEFGDLTQLQIL